MYNLGDDAFAKTRYDEMLKEAEAERRFVHLSGGPSLFARALAVLKRAVNARQAPAPASKPGPAKLLATE